VFSSAGVPLGIARDTVTGQFVGHAVGILDNNGFPLNPLTTPIQLGTSGILMSPTHREFQGVLGGLHTIKNNLGVLQATTAVIGVGTVAGVALSAVNLWQTLKLRQDIKQLRLAVQDGFIDLKSALQNLGLETIRHIDQVAQDIKFEQHRLELIKAYGYFLEATKLMKIAIFLENPVTRTVELANVRQTLGQSLAIYNNPELISETSAAGQLRRLECAWLIEQTIALTYQLQNEPTAVYEHLEHLQETICQSVLEVISQYKNEEEFKFLYSEIKRIKNHDLVAIESWQNHIEWIKYLSNEEQLLLTDFTLTVDKSQLVEEKLVEVNKPEEISLYENLSEKFLNDSLHYELLFMMKPELRQEPELYISQQAEQRGYRTLITSNLTEASDLTIANLYWYFKSKDDSKTQ